jgi:hypothetical protein
MREPSVATSLAPNRSDHLPLQYMETPVATMSAVITKPTAPSLALNMDAHVGFSRPMRPKTTLPGNQTQAPLARRAAKLLHGGG